MPDCPFYKQREFVYQQRTSGRFGDIKPAIRSKRAWCSHPENPATRTDVLVTLGGAARVTCGGCIKNCPIPSNKPIGSKRTAVYDLIRFKVLEA